MIFDNLPMYEREMILYGFENISPESQEYVTRAINRKTGIPSWQIKMEDILNYHKDIKISMQNEFYEIAVSSGFVATNGHKYRTNSDDQTNFIGKMVFLLMKPDITEVSWKTEDAGYINHTKEDWVQVALEGFNHKETQLMKYNEKYTAIKTAKTHAEVVAVSWSGNGSHK